MLLNSCDQFPEPRPNSVFSLTSVVIYPSRLPVAQSWCSIIMSKRWDSWVLSDLPIVG